MKRFLALSLVLTVILMACTLTACSLFGGNDTTSPCKNGHTWEDHEDLGEATCTMSGSVFKKCSVCGIKQEFTTPPIGHELKDKNVYVAPTCTEEGYKGTAICTRSGCDYVDNLEIIPTVDHKYGKWTSVGDGTHKKVCSYDSNHVLIEECSGGTATCSSQATCKTCGGKYGEIGTEHKFNKEIATEEYLNTEATCIELATYFYSCECGEIGDETFEYGDLADHDYVDGFCSVCGEADPTVSISLEGTYTATDDWSNSFAVVVTADTITFTPPMSNEVVVTYTYENGIVTLYSGGSEITNPAAMSLTITDGALVGMMYNMTSYTLTTGGAGEEPEDPEVLPGTFVVEDNNMGVLSGTYGYTIGENNAVIVTKDGEDCSDFMFSIDMGGYWMVQCAGTGPMAQYLCDEEGNYVTELAGTLNVNYLMNGLYVYTFPASEGGEEPEEGGNGTEANPYVVDDMPASITFESDTINKVYYIFTASQTGAITFTWPNADSWYGITELDVNGDNTANTTSGYETTSFSFNVTEGTKYRVELGTWMIAGEVTITVTYGEAGGEEEPEEPTTVDYSATIVDAVTDNPVVGATVTLCVWSHYDEETELDVYTAVEGFDSVVSDENGIVTFVGLDSNVSYYVYVVAENYKSIHSYLYEDACVYLTVPGSNYDTPIEITESSTINVSLVADTYVYYQVTITETNNVKITSESAILYTVEYDFDVWDYVYTQVASIDQDTEYSIIFAVKATEAGDYSFNVVIGGEEPEEPEQPEVITTIAGALAGSEGASVSLSGTVSGISVAWNTQFNNMSYYLTDGTDTILVFRAGGDQVNIGDEVSVVGTVTDYNGTNQVAQGGTTTLVNAHVCSTFTEADCYNAAVCTVCGEANGEALGHTDEEDNNGVCDRCGTDMESAANEVTVTAVYTGTTTTNMTGNNDAALIGLDATIFNVVSTKLGNNHVGLNKDGTIRLYAGTTGCDMTISVVDGYKIVSVKVTLAASNGGTIVVTDGTNTITATDNIYAIDGSTTVLTTSGTTQVRIASIEIVYTTASGSTEDPTDPEQPEECAHEYENACDADCNLCGETRIPADHEYDNACDAECNVCSATREVGDHVGGTATCIALAVCTECGAEYGEFGGHVGGTATCVALAECSECGVEYGELAAHDTTFHEAVESTCIVYGNVEYWACSTCGKNFVSQEGGEEILNVTLDFDADNHENLVTVDAVAATCQSTGLTEGERCLDCGIYTIPQTVTDKLDCVDEDEDDICDVCGSSLTCVHANFTYSVNTEDNTKHDKVCGLCNGVVETVAHVYEQTDYVAPSCTDGGTIEYTCSEYCGHVKYEDIEATGHSTTDLSYTYSDETTHNVICNVCDQEIDVADHAEFSYVVNAEDNTKHDKVCGLCNGVVATSDHNYVETGYTSPDCDDAGSIEYTCSDCGDKKSEEIPATGHSETEFNYSLNTEDNTKHNVLCGICNAVVGTEDHNYEEVDRVAATCVDEGLAEYDCTACGHDYLEELPIDETAHSTTEFTYELNTEDNTKHNVLCGLCSNVVETVDHTYEEVDRVAATCVTTGSIKHTCTACEYDYTEELPIDETAHAWNEGKVTKEATCTQAGEMTFTCTYYSTHTKTEPIEKTDHNYVEGTCTNCPAIEGVEVTFEFGANGTAAHKDGSESKTYTETNNGYTFEFNGASKVYSGAFDAKGNSALKLGTGSVAGEFAFTVPNDIDGVIIYVAKYKTNTSKIAVNGTNYTLTKNSDDGEYDGIVVDTTNNKTITFTTVSGGYRCMINAIKFVKVGCEHEKATVKETIAPTCTEQGYTVYTCTCGEYKWDYTDATGHTMTYVAAVASTCKTEGNIEHWTCSVCEVNHDAEVEGNVIDNVKLPLDEDNHENLVVVEAVAATCQSTGLTQGEKCEACGVVTVEQTVTEKVACVDENGDEVCDVCESSLTCVHADFSYVENTEDNTKHDKVCGLCDGVIETVEHNYEESERVDATCTETGVVLYVCSDCNHEKYEELPELGHSETVTYNNNENGTHNVICSVCNGVVTENAACTYDKNATQVDDTQHTVECACGAVTTENHTEPNAEDKCDVCGAELEVQLVEKTETIAVTGTTGTMAGDNESISWTSDNFSVTNEKGNSTTAIRTSDSDHFRVYKSSNLKITGTNITKIVITCTSSDYATALYNSLTTAGYTASVSDSVVTITVTSGNPNGISFTATAQTRISNVEVTYLG